MEGGVYPWKRQTHDPNKYVTYDDILAGKPLPPPPEGLMWVKKRIVEVEEEEEEEEEEGVLVADGQENEQEQEEEQEEESENVQTTLPEEKKEKEEKPATAKQTQTQTQTHTRCLTRWELVEKVKVVGSKSKASNQGQEDGGSNEAQEGEELEEAAEEEEQYIEHIVLPTDTMAGLRLRYKVTAPQLRQHNDFCGESFHMLMTLRIPIQKGAESHLKKFRQKPTREVLRQQFKNLTKCTDEEEVTYYLETHEYQVAPAVEEWKEDYRWEEEHHAQTQLQRLPQGPGPLAIDAAGAAPSSFASPLLDITDGGGGAGDISIPPPCYSSFFRVPRHQGRNKSTTTSRNTHTHRKKKTYYPWTTLLGSPRSKKGVGAYDMDDFVSPDMDGQAEVVATSACVVAPEQDYVMLSAGEEEEAREVEGVGGGGEGINIPVALVAPSSEDLVDHDHPTAPLLGVTARRG